MTLDRSHHRCPPGRTFKVRQRPSTLGSDPYRIKPSRPLLPNTSEAGGGQPPRHRAASCATCFEQKGDAAWSARQSRSLRHALAGLATDPEGRTHSLFTMSNNTPRDALRRCAGRLSRWRIPWMRTRPSGCSGRARSTVSPVPRRGAVVEQDGIEPTASCLQSTRSTD